jgi:serine/threonine-protein kinase
MANQNGATIAFPDYFALFSEWQKSRIIPLSHAPNQPRLIPQTSPEPVKRRLVAVPLRQIGPYGVVGEVGRGGMGVVYKATDPARDRTVAIKMIQGQAAANSQGRMGLVREARAAGSLRHTNIIEVYDIGQHKGWLYIVMEYLHGAPLHKIISRGNTLQLAQKLRIIIDVCDALDYAHSRGIVHRDVKPGNIFLTRDYVAKVVDFGLAVQDDAPKQKGVAGTIPYIAPEILGGAKPDSASDVWAAAVTMYELVSGKLPFSGPNLLHQIVHSPLPLLDFSLPYASELNCVLGRALSKNKNDRYPTAISFATELRGLLTALE